MQVLDRCQRAKLPLGSEIYRYERAFEFDISYVVGLRKVYPYTYTYLCHCKLRWKGQTVLDVLSNEFIVATPEVHVSVVTRYLTVTITHLPSLLSCDLGIY